MCDWALILRPVPLSDLTPACDGAGSQLWRAKLGREAAEKRRNLRRSMSAAEGGDSIQGGDAANPNAPLMTNDHPIHARDLLTTQVTHTVENSKEMIANHPDGDLKLLLTKLEQDVAALLPQLPMGQQVEAAGNLEQLVEAVTSDQPDEEGYSAASEGLLEAANSVKDLSGGLAGTIASLTEVLGL
jgi:hypothetical protein